MEESVNGYKDPVEALQALAQRYALLRKEIAKRIVGQDEAVESILISIFSRGHALLVGVPGLAKTLLVQTLAQVMDLSFSRIQFTPDLMPSDITGSEILDHDRNYKFLKGPVFAHIVLADEINRTPPKTQAALLEAMQEKRVTVGGTTYALPEPFFVLATQNPIEQEGTYPLPEAQLDRFMFQISLDYPALEEEIGIVKATTLDREVTLNALMGEKEILYFQHLIRQIPVPDPLYEYAVRLVASTRPNQPGAPEITKKYISWGGGPRASQYLIIAAKCHAALHGKFSPAKEDVKAVALSVLRHRVVKNYKAEAEGISIDSLLSQLL
ncbi:MAG: AAA family ATPase [Bacteroides sp.]|nr:AAA family ATPase [Ruminococcus flavefaciens]MCM1554318.1 AAA family ATPase [Bacteroides sp.]